MLPYAFLRPIRLKCPHCGREEVRTRVTAARGDHHTCPYCRKRYVIDDAALRGSSKK